VTNAVRSLVLGLEQVDERGQRVAVDRVAREVDFDVPALARVANVG
jgi:hypothetical protein